MRGVRAPARDSQRGAQQARPLALSSAGDGRRGAQGNGPRVPVLPVQVRMGLRHPDGRPNRGGEGPVKEAVLLVSVGTRPSEWGFIRLEWPSGWDTALQVGYGRRRRHVVGQALQVGVHGA